MRDLAVVLILHRAISRDIQDFRARVLVTHGQLSATGRYSIADMGLSGGACFRVVTSRRTRAARLAD
jgi:hypothetical protein